MNTIRKIEYKHNYIAKILNSNRLDIIYSEKLEEFYAYMNMIHPDISENEFVSFFIKNDLNYARWGVNGSDWDKLYKLLDSKYNVYCSVNSFYKATECISKYVKKLNLLMVDLDYYNKPEYKGLTATQMIELLKNDVDYLEPSFYVDSGRGLYLIWLLENTYATTKSKSFWSKIEKQLIEKFKDFGADEKVKDVSRVLRIPGSTNTKTGRKVKIILPSNENRTLEEYVFNPKRFELSDVANYYWGDIEDREVKKKVKKKLKTSKKIVALKTIKNLHYTRTKDLENLVRLRESLEGHREYLLFLYRLNLLYADIEPTKALEMTLELNRNINDPLEENEVEKATESAENNAEVYFRLKNKYDEEKDGISLNEYLSQNGAYLYKNSTITKELKITDDEMIKLDTLIDSNEKNRRKSIRNKEYYNTKGKDDKKKKYEEKRKSKGKLSRNEKNREIRAKIKSLLQEGFNQKTISTKLGVDASTISRHIKSIREETK